jgi:hypothetical protein
MKFPVETHARVNRLIVRLYLVVWGVTLILWRCL